MKVQTLTEILECTSIGALSKYRGIFTYRHGFYYTMGLSSSVIQKNLEEKLCAAGIKYEILDRGRFDAPFGGGLPLAKSSHFWVKFKILENM